MPLATLGDVAANIGLAVVITVVGGIIGIAMVLLSSAFLPRFIDRLTPNIDEEKELVRGNNAVAEYFGRVSAAAIIGASIVIAAATIGGILAALHG